jgi:hypothetical protein
VSATHIDDILAENKSDEGEPSPPGSPKTISTGIPANSAFRKGVIDDNRLSNSKRGQPKQLNTSAAPKVLVISAPAIAPAPATKTLILKRTTYQAELEVENRDLKNKSIVLSTHVANSSLTYENNLRHLRSVLKDREAHILILEGRNAAGYKELSSLKTTLSSASLVSSSALSGPPDKAALDKAFYSSQKIAQEQGFSLLLKCLGPATWEHPRQTDATFKVARVATLAHRKSISPGSSMSKVLPQLGR